jgi:hypothetical protein
MRRRSLLILPGVMAVLAALMFVRPLAAAAASPPGAPPDGASGHDISWPQCGSTYPGDGAFGIVGVTYGRAWSANPCLVPEYQWAAGYPRTPDLYMNTANPAPQSSYYWPASGARDPALCQDATSTTDPGCAYDYGWHTAMNALATATSALGNLPQGIWWLDVETDNTWNGDASSNAADVQGSIDYLLSQHAAGVGVYSTGYQWGTITGGYATSNASTYAAAWQPEFTSPNGIASVPSWVAGASGPSDAPGDCGSSFLGTTTWMVQYISNSVDVDYACATAPPPPPSYSITASSIITARPGTTVTTPITVTSTSSWSGTVAFSVSAPGRVTATLSTGSLSVSPNSTNTVTLTLRSGTNGICTVTVTARPGSGSTTSATHRASLSFYVSRRSLGGQLDRLDDQT